MLTRYYDKKFGEHTNIHEAALHRTALLAHPGAVATRPSRIHGAGLGLFATEPIPGNRVIGEYTGTIRKYDECNLSWSMHTSKGPDFMIDASTSRRSCPVRFINDTPPPLANCIMRELYADGRVFIVSKKAIPAGAELLYFYGHAYNRKWLN